MDWVFLIWGLLLTVGWIWGALVVANLHRAMWRQHEFNDHILKSQFATIAAVKEGVEATDTGVLPPEETPEETP